MSRKLTKLRNYVAIDCETTIKNKGSPFTPSNKLCLVGLHDKDGHHEYDVEYSGSPYGEAIRDIQDRCANADLLIGFNIKFDLHWLRRYGVSKFPSVYDCQLGEFILSNQSKTYPSLDESCSSRGLGVKHDVVRVEYWDNGIDTTEIPKDILSEYLKRDVDLTRALFEAQRGLFTPKQRRLFSLQCEDLLILEEMEWNGMLYDRKGAELFGAQARASIEKIDRLLVEISQFVCNWGSSDDISCLLYGGYVSVPFRETVTRLLKSGKISERERWAYRNQTFPQLVKPIRGSEVKPTSELGDEELERFNIERAAAGKRPLQRHWSVSEPVLRQLKAKGKAAKIIELMLERAKLEKLDSTYYSGLVSKYEEQEWTTDKLHGQFNQCVARTGRLSSSGPNLQNFSGDIKELFYSRFV